MAEQRSQDRGTSGEGEGRRRYPPLSQRMSGLLRLFHEEMGIRPDGEIARLAGVDRRYVVIYRYHEAIPPYQRPDRVGVDKELPPGPMRPRRSRLDIYRHMIGQVVDREIAEIACCTREAVMRYRRRHGIPAASRGGAASSSGQDDGSPGSPDRAPGNGGPLAAQPPGSRTASDVWLACVELGGDKKELIVAGADLPLAARLLLEASRVMGARVVSLTLYGKLLGSP